MLIIALMGILNQGEEEIYFPYCDLYDSAHEKCPRCGQQIQYVGILELASLMGHEDVKTTMGYIAISDRVLRKTAIPDKRFNEIEEDR